MTDQLCMIETMDEQISSYPLDSLKEFQLVVDILAEFEDKDFTTDPLFLGLTKDSLDMVMEYFHLYKQEGEKDEFSI